ncbi:hypothetical protein ACPOL_0541 [Acidisarcina polymorpha]|uniref:Uncharacterized protein n=1 Tax=Acidisarcina polymorpha TaxID=2211140 RepID=A0A2Z5FTU9_9BACT|nr:hypothetical protein ACPOL_0541 [Acidisarcina polymorpha]
MIEKDRGLRASNEARWIAPDGASGARLGNGHHYLLDSAN